jgi:glucokinase
MSRILLGDIGGTYARFALAGERSIGSTWSTEVGARESAIEALGAFLALDHGDEPVAGALLAAAGPVEGGRCRLTNAAWVLDEEQIARALQLPWVRVVNDLEAVASGLPDIHAGQARPIGPGSGIPGAPMAIVAPGTGLGMACVVVGPAGRCVVTSEGGHAALAATNENEDRIIGILRKRFGRVSAERVLSGPGLANLHQAIAELDGCGSSLRRTPSEVTAAAFDGSSPVCRAAIDAFCAFLGAVAGDIALTFGARGGVYVGGGIVPRFIDHLARSAFRDRFIAKGRMRPYLEPIPTRVIVHPNPAFLGLMSLARLALGESVARGGVRVD